MSPPPPPSLPSRPPDARRRGPSGRPLAVGLAVSAAVHLAFLALYPLLAPRPGELALPGLSSPTGAPVEAPAGTALLRIVELPAEAAAEEPDAPDAPEPELAPERPSPPRPPVVPAPGAAPGPGPRAAPTDDELMSAAERLRPRLRDARLWAPLPENLAALSDEQRRKLDFALRLASVADSMVLAAEAARRATDWTFTDSEGKRWGVSPGKIHLGDLTLPLPFGFAAPWDPSAGDGWQWEDLERGAAATEVRETLKERQRAIRERTDRERERIRPGPVRPDTLRLRR